LGPGRFAAFAALLSALSSWRGCALQLDRTLSRADADVEQTGSIDNVDRQAGATKQS